MQRTSQPIGLLAFALGALSLVLVLSAMHLLTSQWHVGSWKLLYWADRLGILADPATAGLPAFRPRHFLDLDDYVALQVFAGFGLYIGASALIVAFWAELREEENLYPAAGVLCASLSVMQVDRAMGIATLIAVTAAITAVRAARVTNSHRIPHEA